MTKPVRRPRRLPSELRWAVGAPILTLAIAVLPLARVRDFYFRDDTEVGAAPVWFHLGELLRAGQWPILHPSSWMSGNIAAEGQWGLWSPITLGIAYLSGFTDSLLAFSTVVKLVFLAVAALGVYLLARTYDVRPPLAFAAGVAVPMNGFTLYMDAPSWVTGLMTWALLPYAWAALRRSTARRTSPVPFLVAAYLIVTIGYFHGFLALGVVVIAVGVDRLCVHDWRGVRTVVLGGVFSLLVAATVYLPGILSADVTSRSATGVVNNSFLTADVTGLLAAASPTAMYGISGWWGNATTTPIMFVAWFLPVLLMLSWRRLRGELQHLRDVAITGTAAALVAFGPSDLGPLRYPVRVMPYVALALVLAVVVCLDRTLPFSPPRKALAWASAWVGGACYLGYAQRPEQAGGIALVTALVLGSGVALVWLLLRRVGNFPAGRGVSALAGLLALGVLAGTWSQVWLFPTSPLSHYDMPGRLADYQTQLPEAVNDVIVVGGGVTGVPERPESRFDDERKPVAQKDLSQHWGETLVGNSWLLNNPQVQNTYSVILHADYSRILCINHRGETCGNLLPRLFRDQPRVYVPLVDLLSIDTVLILKNQVAPQLYENPPSGWSVGRDRPMSVSWVRDDPVGPAGGVTWTSPGTEVTEISRTDRSVRVRIDDLGSGPSRMVLSRLAWPGYEVEGAQLEELPLNGYLLAVDLSQAEEGDVVSVSFSPPAWKLIKATWVLALALAAAWSLWHVWHTRQAVRGRRSAPATGLTESSEGTDPERPPRQRSLPPKPIRSPTT